MRHAPEIELALTPRPPGMLRQRWLYDAIRHAIVSGQMAPGARLPTTRDLARAQGVSRSTMVTVFEQLAAEGYVDSVVGKGSFVSSRLPTRWPTAASAPPRSAPSAHAERSGLSARGQLLAGTPFPIEGRALPVRAFRPNMPELTLFPFATWARISARWSRLTERRLMTEVDTRGFLPLRESIAEHLRQTRGIACRADQLVIVGSVQQALDLLARLLLDPGDAAWVEDPGYPGARLVLASAGARIVGVPVNESGIDVAAGIALAPAARLAYVTSGRQSPLGMPLSLERRLSLLAWASQAGSVVIEDDYDSEFRFEGSPIAPLKSLDVDDRVVYAGNLSKMLFPSLRLSFVVLPDRLVGPFAAALSLTTRYLTPVVQAVMHEFIAEGHFSRHLRRMRLLYAERALALRLAIERHVGEALLLPPILMGLDTPAFLPPGSNEARVVEAANAAGIETRGLAYYAFDRKAQPGLMLGFSAVTPAEIDAGSRMLAQVLKANLRA